MFKENKEFWLYILGTIILFFVLFFFFRPNLNGSLFSGSFSSSTSAKPTTSVKPTETKLNTNVNYFATLKTNKGDLLVDLFEKNAPNTVNNFINLAINNYYNGTKFYRLVSNVLIQGGSKNTLNSDPNDDQFGGPGYTIDDEINWDSLDYSSDLQNKLSAAGYKSARVIKSVDVGKYRLAMAGPTPNSAGSQFFIILGDQSSLGVQNLKGRHTVFGEVTDGREIVDSFNSIPVDNPTSTSPRPTQDIIINSIEVYYE